MNNDMKTKIRSTLEKCWSSKTCLIFTENMPSYGQCAQTSIVINEIFGGEILKTSGWHGEGRHFYNQIDGERCDFTADQFTVNPDYCWKIEYSDIPSSIEEAATEAYELQVNNLRSAFKREWEAANAG